MLLTNDLYVAYLFIITHISTRNMAFFITFYHTTLVILDTFLFQLKIKILLLHLQTAQNIFFDFTITN